MRLVRQSARRCTTILAAVALIALTAGRVEAQRALESVGPSEAVRVRAAEVHLEGTLVSAGPDSLLVQTVDGPRSTAQFRQHWMPLECVTDVRVAAGRESASRWGMGGGAVGLVGGAAVGAMVGWLQAKSAHVGGGRYAGEASQHTATGPYIRSRATQVGVAGLVTGAVIGVVRRPSRWSEVTLPRDAGRGANVGRCASFHY